MNKKFDEKATTNRIRQKSAILAITLTLILATSMFMVTLPMTSAADYTKTFPTYSFLVVSPDPIGVNQPVNVVFWQDSAPPQRAGESYYGWQGIMVEITKPDGSVEKKGPFETDSVGGKYMLYTPKATGTYKFKVTFPGQEVNLPKAVLSYAPGLYYFEPSESRVVELNVTAEQVQNWPETPVSSDYWTRPVSAENRDWYRITGDWLESMSLGAKGFNAFTTAPETAHIVWTKPLSFGGIANGDLGWGKAYYNGIVYEKRFSPPVIISGYLFYNMFPGSGYGSSALPGVVCLDIRTGEEIWRNESMPQITRGQVLNFEGENQYGAIAYLWAVSGTKWQMYDAFTGRLVSTIENATSGTWIYGPKGELLVYTLSGATNQLMLWNSTRTFTVGTSSWNAGSWRPSSVVDWKQGLQWNVSVPDVTGSQAIRMIDEDAGVIVAETTVNDAPTFLHIGYSTTTGEQLWQKERTGYGYGFSGPNSPGLMSSMSRTMNEGVYVFYQKETLKWFAFDAKTGNELWSTEPMNQFTDNDYSMYDWAAKIAYGKLYITGYTGNVIAFDVKTGNHLWTYLQPSGGLQTPYGSWPVLDGGIVADNKVYIPCVEHTPYTPMMMGYTLYCVDGESGDFVWNTPGFFTQLAIADGYLVADNGYDNQIYCFGKGPSLTTVSIQDDVVSKGQTILIAGTVTDQSTGQKDSPAIADEDMTEWMAYLYSQRPKPIDAKGVQVSLVAVDSNGNVEEIGAATSDMYGNFGKAWTPTKEGTYQIIAQFAGTNSYGSSVSSTYVTVGTPSASAAPTTTAPTTQAPTQTSTAPTPSPSTPEGPTASSNTVLYVTIAAVVAIVVIAAIAVFLKKRKN